MFWATVRAMFRATLFLVIGTGVLSGSLRDAARAQSPPTPPAHAIYSALNALRVNPGQIYNVKDLDLRRDAVHITFIEGEIAFLEPFEGKVTGFVFSGRGHILAIPRDPIEKASMARFLGTPLLDQEFTKTYARFDDGTAEELHSALLAAGAITGSDPDLASEWDPLIASLNPGHSLRVLTDLLASRPLPYFYAGFVGQVSGPFDVLIDNRRPEQVLLGQPKIVNDHLLFDIWTSYRRPNVADSSAPFSPLSYSLETTVRPDLTLSGVATLSLGAVGTGERAVSLELSNLLRVDSVADENDRPLEFFQGEPVEGQDAASPDDDSLIVVLPEIAQAGKEFRLRISYRGQVIRNAGNGVFYVGEHGTWYPHVSGLDTFATFDMKFRWPHSLRLVATGQKLDEHEDGDWREGHWRSEKPVLVAGFNLGAYSVSSVDSAGVKINMYANSQLEQVLETRPSRRTILTPVPEEASPGVVHPMLNGSSSVPNVAPNPAAGLHQLGEEIAQAVQFFGRFGGPFPFEHLEVSQIPGTFGQGWPELLYLPTYSFLSTETQRRIGLNKVVQEHFTEIVPYHEAAHQWWGNTVAWHSYRDQWISEGIANYIALMFAESRKDSGHALNIWLNRYKDSLTANLPGKEDPVDSTGPLALGYRLRSSLNLDGYDEVTYAKATWVFHMIRMMLRNTSAKDPDERFVALIRSLTESHQRGFLTTADLQGALEKTMLPAMNLEGDHSMEWFFDEWVRATGIPHYKVEFTVQKSGEEYVVKGSLNQSDVPSTFLESVPLYTQNALGKPELLGHVTTSGEKTSFRFVTRFAPKRILVDPFKTLLCRTD
ncbi:MAG: M1 family aminopeptidase [Candidatus Acidiferrales bacterium]